jgi:hypothetical protein
MAHPDTRRISFTYAPMASMWVVALHSLFLYLEPPLPCHPPSDWLRLFSSQTFSHTNTWTFSNLVIHHTYLPIKMEQTVCSKTSAYKIQTPGNYLEESIQQGNLRSPLASLICQSPISPWTLHHSITMAHISQEHQYHSIQQNMKLFMSINHYLTLYLILCVVSPPQKCNPTIVKGLLYKCIRCSKPQVTWVIQPRHLQLVKKFCQHKV